MLLKHPTVKASFSSVIFSFRFALHLVAGFVCNALNSPLQCSASVGLSLASFIVCCRQTIVRSHQTIVCCHQTIVWPEQTKQKRQGIARKATFNVRNDAAGCLQA